MARCSVHFVHSSSAVASVVSAIEKTTTTYGEEEELLRLLKWKKEPVFQRFSVDIVKLIGLEGRSMSKFHQISSLSIPPLWEALWTNLKLSPIKALNCQSVNRQLLCQVFEEEMSTPAPLKQVSMSSEEENAVRYASGFVPMRLMKKYKKINNTKAAQFVDCLSHMALSSSDEDEESSYYEYMKTWNRYCE